MSRPDRQSMQKLLPAAYKRWPILAGVAAGLWVLVLYYLVRMIVTLVRGETATAWFSLVWSLVCLVLWTALHQWAKRQPAD